MQILKNISSNNPKQTLRYPAMRVSSAESDARLSSNFAPSTPNMQEINTTWKNQTSY